MRSKLLEVVFQISPVGRLEERERICSRLRGLLGESEDDRRVRRALGERA